MAEVPKTEIVLIQPERVSLRKDALMRALLALLLSLLAGVAHAQTIITSSSGNAYPPGSSPVFIGATGTTGTVAASIGAVANQKSWLCGLAIYSDATAETVGTATIGGLPNNSLSIRQLTQAVATGTGVTTLNFSPCLPSSAVNTAIIVTSAAAGSGGNTFVNIWGYNQ
jgi:hypothetical protein